MAKNRHTFAKRQREIEKKRKADEKRERRRTKGQGVEVDEENAGSEPVVDPAAGDVASVNTNT